MRIALLICAASFSLPAWACPGVSASDAWIREAPPGASVMAGYITLTNTSGKPQTLRGLSSTDFGAVEIHRTITENGQSHMEALDTLAIPAHGTTRLAPGDAHLMLFRAQRPLKAGDTVKMQLSCGRKQRLLVDFAIRAAP